MAASDDVDSAEADRLRALAGRAADQLEELVTSLVRARSALDWEHNLNEVELALLDDQVRRARGIVSMLRIESRAQDVDPEQLGWLVKAKRKIGVGVLALGFLVGTGAAERGGEILLETVLGQADAISETEEQIDRPGVPEQQGLEFPATGDLVFDGESVPDEVPPGFGAELKQRRLAAGLTQAELGQMIGEHQRTVSSWELGGRLPEGRRQERAFQAIDQFQKDGTYG